MAITGWNPKSLKIRIEMSVNSLSALSKASSIITGANLGLEARVPPSWYRSAATMQVMVSFCC